MTLLAGGAACARWVDSAATNALARRGTIGESSESSSNGNVMSGSDHDDEHDESASDRAGDDDKGGGKAELDSDNTVTASAGGADGTMQAVFCSAWRAAE